MGDQNHLEIVLERHRCCVSAYLSYTFLPTLRDTVSHATYLDSLPSLSARETFDCFCAFLRDLRIGRRFVYRLEMLVTRTRERKTEQERKKKNYPRKFIYK